MDTAVSQRFCHQARRRLGACWHRRTTSLLRATVYQNQGAQSSKPLRGVNAQSAPKTQNKSQCSNFRIRNAKPEPRRHGQKYGGQKNLPNDIFLSAIFLLFSAGARVCEDCGAPGSTGCNAILLSPQPSCPSLSDFSFLCPHSSANKRRTEEWGQGNKNCCTQTVCHRRDCENPTSARLLAATQRRFQSALPARQVRFQPPRR